MGAKGRDQGEKVQGPSTYINERGEVCIGDKCFTMGYDQDTDEIRVEVDADSCPPELLDAVHRMTGAVAKGAPTQYHVKRREKARPADEDRCPHCGK